MSRPDDFGTIRKKKLRRRKFVRFLVIVLVIGLAFVTYTYRYEITSQGFGVLLSDQFAMMTQTNQFPVATSDEPIDLLMVGQRPAVVTASSVCVYSPIGEKKIDNRVTGESMIAVSAGNYLLTYARGGYELRVQSGETELFTLRTDAVIQAATISRSGAVAVSTAQSGSVSCVRVYNSSYRQVFEWTSNQAIVTTLDLSENGASLAVGSVYSDGGILSSRVRAFTVRDGSELLNKELADEMILSLYWQKSDTLTAVCDRAAYRISQTGESSVTFDSDLAAFSILSDGSVAVATGDYLTTHQADLALYSADMEKTASTALSEEVRSLIPCDSGVLVFTGERVIRYTNALERAATIETSGALQVACVGSHLYYTTVSYLYQTTLR